MATITKPPITGHFRTHRLWTVNEIPFDRLPDFFSGGPPLVAIDGWCISYPRLCRLLSSAAVVEADDGKVTLRAFRVVSEQPYRSEKHPLDGTKYDTERDANRAVYDAGLLAYMVRLEDEKRYGL